MTKKDRDGVRNNVTRDGGKDSAYDRNVQFINGVKVTHIGTNRTQIGLKTYYGSSDANKALDDLK
jgi:hypothetical protein